MSNDTVTVYWSPIVKGTHNLYDLNDDVSELKFFEPIPVNQTIDQKEFFGPSASRCPAMIDELTRTFAIRAPIDFYADYDYANMAAKFKYEYDNDFNLNFAGPPNDERIHQMRYPAYLLFSEEPGLTVTQLPAYYENNNFNKTCKVLSGTFDISSWVRQWQPAFKFYGDTVIDIQRGDVLLYYRVNTTKKVKLVKFDSDNHDTRKMIERCLGFKHYKPKFLVPHKLSECYEAFTRHKMKTKMLKIIKENLYE